MKFEVNNEVVFIDTDRVTSVSIMEDAHWQTKEPMYHVEIMAGGFNSRVFTSSEKSNAKDMQMKIGLEVEKKSPEKTYLDGFKDGTEYALKLIEKRPVNAE